MPRRYKSLLPDSKLKKIAFYSEWFEGVTICCVVRMNNPSKYALKGCYWYSTVVLIDNLSWTYHLYGKKAFVCLFTARKRWIKASN